MIFKRIIESMGKNNLVDSIDNIKVYKNSFAQAGKTKLLMVKYEDIKYILALGEDSIFNELEGKLFEGYKVCPTNHKNRLVINKYFHYTVPRAFGKNTATIGLGDRLGIASAAHLKLIKGRDIKPVLAQQSIREITLLGRTYEDVMDDACYAVFQEGYKDGFGADGDHLKLEKDIQMSLDLGFTMLTLDCSEKIDNTVAHMTEKEVEDKYNKLSEKIRKYYEEKYLEKTFKIGESEINYDKLNFMKDVLIYGETINFVEYIYNKYIKTSPRAIDFEVSIDETLTPTSPEAHFLVSNELKDRNVDANSMAPRFCGEFQKGIDYIGDLKQFEKEFKVHSDIADHFGYKISIHSGSDKFSVFPIIGKYTKGRFHVKTAGTNWLEAMRVVSRVNPSLYRRMHAYALEHFEEATAYYHVTTDIDAIKPLDKVNDSELPEYLNDNNARQLIHITYGILLQAKDASGKYLFKDEFYKTMSRFEEEYDKGIYAHIGKHLELLNK